MSYIEQTLGNNEKILYRAHIHSIFFARLWVCLVIAIALIVWLRYEELIGVALALTLAGISILIFLSFFIPLWALEFALTDLRLVFKRGFIKRSTHELQLQTVEEINVTQDIWGRVLNYGVVDVRGIGDAHDLVFKHISDPLRFRREIASAVAAMSDRLVAGRNMGEASAATAKQA